MEPHDKDILDFKVGDTTIRDMTALTFLQWISKKIDGYPSYKGAIVELSLAISNPPIMQKMEDNGKITLVRKMLSAGITL